MLRDQLELAAYRHTRNHTKRRHSRAIHTQKGSHSNNHSPQSREPCRNP